MWLHQSFLHNEGKEDRVVMTKSEEEMNLNQYLKYSHHFRCYNCNFSDYHLCELHKVELLTQG